MNEIWAFVLSVTALIGAITKFRLDAIKIKEARLKIEELERKIIENQGAIYRLTPEEIAKYSQKNMQHVDSVHSNIWTVMVVIFFMPVLFLPIIGTDLTPSSRETISFQHPSSPTLKLYEFPVHNYKLELNQAPPLVNGMWKPLSNSERLSALGDEVIFIGRLIDLHSENSSSTRDTVRELENIGSKIKEISGSLNEVKESVETHDKD